MPPCVYTCFSSSPGKAVRGVGLSTNNEITLIRARLLDQATQSLAAPRECGVRNKFPFEDPWTEFSGQDRHVSERTPDPRVRVPEQCHGRNADRRGQVRNTTVITDVQAGLTRQTLAEFAKRRSHRQFSGDAALPQSFPAWGDQLEIGFAEGHHHASLSKALPCSGELRKHSYRPVLGATPAAGMQPEKRRIGTRCARCIDQPWVPQQVWRRTETRGVEKTSSAMGCVCRARIMPEHGTGSEPVQPVFEGRVPGEKEVDPGALKPSPEGWRDGAARGIQCGHRKPIDFQESFQR